MNDDRFKSLTDTVLNPGISGRDAAETAIRLAKSNRDRSWEAGARLVDDQVNKWEEHDGGQAPSRPSQACSPLSNRK